MENHIEKIVLGAMLTLMSSLVLMSAVAVADLNDGRVYKVVASMVRGDKQSGPMTLNDYCKKLEFLTVQQRDQANAMLNDGDSYEIQIDEYCSL